MIHLIAKKINILLTGEAKLQRAETKISEILRDYQENEIFWEKEVESWKKKAESAAEQTLALGAIIESMREK